MSNSVLKQSQLDSRHTSNQVWIGEQLFEEVKTFADQINLSSSNVARTAASGSVGISTAGLATFSASQAAILAVGDYFVVSGVKYTIVTGGNGTTTWQVTPAPTVAVAASGNVTIVDDGTASTSTFVTAPGFVVGSTFIANGTTYTVRAVLTSTTFTTTPDTANAAGAYTIGYQPVNQLSYWDFPSVGMVGCRPIPEGFRMRFGGSLSLADTAATFQFVRVDAVTGFESPITAAVATTSAAIWAGVAITPFGEQLPFNSSQYFPIGGTTRAEMPVDEFIRLVMTAKTTITTGRTLLVEMALRRATGPDAFSATP